MAQALKRHVNRRMVVCLQRDAQVQFENTVGALQQPVTSARQNLPAKSRAFEVAANDRHDTANAVGQRTELLWRGGGGALPHQWSRVFCGALPPPLSQPTSCRPP